MNDGEKPLSVPPATPSPERRQLDLQTFSMAQRALEMSSKASQAIDGHIQECANNYRDMAYVLKLILGVLGAGTLLIVTALGGVAWAMFEYILTNPRLLPP